MPFLELVLSGAIETADSEVGKTASIGNVIISLNILQCDLKLFTVIPLGHLRNCLNMF